MGELYHLQVGCADCTVINSDNYTFLIDCHNIEKHSHLLPASKNLQGVFITHQHYDHFDGLGYLKDNDYYINCLIYSPYQRRYDDNSVEYQEWQDFIAYRDYFKQKGTKLYSPYRQDNFDNPWWEIDGLKFFILGPAIHIAISETRELHDACLVIHAKLGSTALGSAELSSALLRSRRCLFTGDASDKSLKYIASNTNHICDDILHASHHGSINGADIDFIKSCNADYTVVSTEPGVHNNIPSQTAMQRYINHTKKKVYRTDLDGSLNWSF